VKKVVNSVCTYCGVGCEISATVEDNKVVRIEGLKEGVVSRGKLCIKGKKGFKFLTSKERITQPLIEKAFAKKMQIPTDKLIAHSARFYKTDVETATKAVAQALFQSIQKHTPYSHASIGGARTSCENGYFFQKFTREYLGSPNIDSCARICHSPSLKGMKTTIGEGAASNNYDSIFESEFLLVIGSNTTQAHPIVSGKMIKSKVPIATIDVRQIELSKKAKYHLTIPFESNLMIVNMLTYVILNEKLYDEAFVQKRTSGFESFKQKILNDPFANPEYLLTLEGYEDLYEKVHLVAREYATKKSMIFWGLGVTEHEAGSKSVMAITHLALITGNIGKKGTGLMPLRGQNNVQGTCDMGCLPYFSPDYNEPQEIGLMTPQIVEAILEGKIKTLYNIGEDLAHVHPNQNVMHKALQMLDLIVVHELFETEITKFAHVVFGVKSAYEKRGIYINAERRLHLSTPLVSSNLPDDWEVLQNIAREAANESNYGDAKAIWEEVRKVAPTRFSGASYELLENNPLQWPVKNGKGSEILHQDSFRTDDRLGHFHYHGYKPKSYEKPFVLTTGRVLYQYNNGAQTKQTQDMMQLYPEDILEVSSKDKDFFTSERVILKSRYGQSAPLKITFNDSLKKGTLFTTFHHAKSKINFLFGDECDDMIHTARFKAVEVDVEKTR
jgi:formate dehydrogenase major subunit